MSGLTIEDRRKAELMSYHKKDLAELVVSKDRNIKELRNQLKAHDITPCL